VIKLLLFDIDGTLVLTGGAGGRAMARAARDLFAMDDTVASISMAGRTDAWIVGQMARAQGVEHSRELLERFREIYLRYLQLEIHAPGPQKGVLPGIRPVLQALAARQDAHLALLTGNFEAGARIKLEYFELSHYFSSGAFGDELHDRNALLDIAIARTRDTGGPSVRPSDVLIIGDTPHDVAVAVAGGARSLAVATGGYGVDELKASGADVVLSDFTDLRATLAGMGLSA
jgi:phosphoglycolate phosphatase-like HAD superfamily hydrolase